MIDHVVIAHGGNRLVRAMSVFWKGSDVELKIVGDYEDLMNGIALWMGSICYRRQA